MTSAVTRRPRVIKISTDQQAIDIQLNEGTAPADVKTALNGLVRSRLVLAQPPEAWLLTDEELDCCACGVRAGQVSTRTIRCSRPFPPHRRTSAGLLGPGRPVSDVVAPGVRGLGGAPGLCCLVHRPSPGIST